MAIVPKSSSTKRVVSRKRQSGRAELTSVQTPADAAGVARVALEKVLRDPSVLDAVTSPPAMLRDVLQQVRALQADNERLSRRVTGLARELAKARAFAYHDELTGLPNRRLLLDHFRQARAHAQRCRERLAVLFIDLDGFKQVNDRYGHLAGDRILKDVAARLKDSVRDDETACRFGGDEFVVLLSDCKSGDAAAVVVERIRARLSKGYVLDGVRIELTASVGMAIYPDDGGRLLKLIQASDVSMLSEKRRDRSMQPEAP